MFFLQSPPCLHSASPLRAQLYNNSQRSLLGATFSPVSSTPLWWTLISCLTLSIHSYLISLWVERKPRSSHFFSFQALDFCLLLLMLVPSCKLKRNWSKSFLTWFQGLCKNASENEMELPTGIVGIVNQRLKVRPEGGKSANLLPTPSSPLPLLRKEKERKKPREEER